MARVPRGGTSRLLAAVAPMLAAPDGGRLPDSPNYTYEFKYDGYLY
jgi:bifunctional non-homologous end joining protein LigD